MRTSLLRYGSLVLALSTGIAVAHCGGDSTDGGDIPTDETGTDETSVDSGTDETQTDTAIDDSGSMDETSSDSGSMDETAADSSTDSAATETGDTGGSTEAGDSAATETGDTSTTEVGGDTAVGDAADAGDSFSCGTLSASAVDVYVDKASALPSVGTSACPFHTIKEATDLAAVAGRTIHVKGGSAATPANYAEAGAVVVKTGVTLLGDGLATTKITNTAACSSGNCAVEVNGGGTIDGFTVTGTGNGILASAGDAGAMIKNVEVTGAQDGVLALGVVTLDGVQLLSNKGAGLHANATASSATAVRLVKVQGTGNQFDMNDGDGVFVQGASQLDFRGGTANQNKGNGVNLSTTYTASASTQHSIKSLTAKQNGNATGAKSSGINVSDGSSVKIRDSILLGNESAGLTFTYGTNALDIGTVTENGGNQFGSGTTINRNKGASICLSNSGATASQPAIGDSWNACSGTPTATITQTSVSSCSSLGTTGTVDVAYKAKTGGVGSANPVLIGAACTVGP